MNPFGIYIHIPFCSSKCIYCDFFSANVSLARWQQYVSSILKEYECRRSEVDGTPDTIYIGGGTPSLMPETQFRQFVDGIREFENGSLELSEFTIEVNPEDVSAEKCRIWKEEGVNRVSMGAQSFVDSELSLIHRRHSADKIRESFGILREYFSNISIDLMFGLPGQTLESWRYTVEEAINLGAEHISAYSLMFEEKTPITVLRDTGRMEFPEESECIGMFEYLSRRLKMSGYSRYEISNYSIPGKESVHNRRYWTGVPYIGLGPSAHSFDGKDTRRSNPISIKNYMDYYSNSRICLGESEFFSKEVLSEEEKIEEYIMLRMRMREGIQFDDFESRFGLRTLESLKRNSMKQIKLGTVERIDSSIRLTNKGIMTADAVILSLLM